MTRKHTSSHTETTENLQGEVRQRVMDCLSSLNWSITVDDTDGVTARVPMSFWSWGEEVSIEFKEANGLVVTSTSRVPTTVFDWGKNKANAHQLIASLHEQGC